MTETVNQNVQNTEEMNNLKNEIRQRNAVLIDQQTKRQIQEWLEGNPYQELLEYMKSRVMGQENMAIVVANVYNYLKNVSIPETGMEMPTHGNCNNMILAAPSGSGKTETYRAFKDYFKKRIPALRLTISDVSNLTATGYRGAEPSSIWSRFSDADWSLLESYLWMNSTRSALHHTAPIMEMSIWKCSIICLRWLRDQE